MNILDFLDEKQIEYSFNDGYVIMFLPLQHEGHIYGHQAYKLHGIMHCMLLLRGYLCES